MKLTKAISCLATLALASGVIASDRTAIIYIQSVARSPASPALLAEIQYNLDEVITQKAEVISYEAPELPEEASLVRVGAYDPSTKQWISSISVTSVENFGKGYSPTFILSVSQRGDIISVALRGVRIDAGRTRDFGPQAIIRTTDFGKQPDLNKPVVLSPEGKKVEPQEKGFIQKYWWLMGIFVLITMAGGGGGGDAK